MGKTKAGKGKIVARIFLVIGILLSMTAAVVWLMLSIPEIKCWV